MNITSDRSKGRAYISRVARQQQLQGPYFKKRPSVFLEENSECASLLAPQFFQHNKLVTTAQHKEQTQGTWSKTFCESHRSRDATEINREYEAETPGRVFSDYLVPRFFSTQAAQSSRSNDKKKGQSNDIETLLAQVCEINAMNPKIPKQSAQPFLSARAMAQGP